MSNTECARARNKGYYGLVLNLSHNFNLRVNLYDIPFMYIFYQYSGSV